MAKDTCEFVAACPVCSQSKFSHQPPSGLCPLPVPQRPWFHIAVDFVSGLPEGNTVVLTIVFPRWPTSFNSPNYLLWQRLLICWCCMCFAYMVFWWTLSLIGAPSSLLIYGRRFVLLWVSLPASPQVTTHRPTVRLSVLIRSCRRHCVPCPLNIPHFGALSCHGWSTPTILTSALPQVCLHSW